MAIIRDCEIWYAKLNPEKPSKKVNAENPTWEVQLRTKSKDQANEWRALGIRVTAVRQDEDAPIDYYRANLRKKSKKSSGEDGKAPDLIDGDMKPVDPESIGNGSIANIRIFQYDYTDRESGQSGKASVLMGVQLTTHIVYVPRVRDEGDEFGTATTVRVEAPTEEATPGAQATPAPKPAPAQAAAAANPHSANIDPDEIF